MGKIRKTNLASVSILLSFCLILFVALAVCVKLNKVESLNNWIYNLLVSPIKCKTLTNIFKLLTYLGNFYFLLVVCLLFAFKNKRTSIMLVSALLFVGILSFLVKIIIRSPRPQDLMLIKESGYSFPSAHASMSGTIYGLIAFVLSTNSKLKWQKVLTWTISILLILFISFTRIYLGVHFFTDILAGLFLAIIVITIFAVHTKHKKPNQ